VFVLGVVGINKTLIFARNLAVVGVIWMCAKDIQIHGDSTVKLSQCDCFVLLCLYLRWS